MENLPDIPKKERKPEGPISKEEKFFILKKYTEILQKQKELEIEQEKHAKEIEKMEAKFPFFGYLRGQYGRIFSENLERKRDGSKSSVVHSPAAKKRKIDEEEKEPEKPVQ